jgi:hypothetical protein
MATSDWRSTVGFVAAGVILAASIALVTRAIGEDSPPGDPADAQPQRVIVLSTGSVIFGDVVERPGGYLVQEQYGSVVIPFTQVLLTAANLPDAYRKLSGRLKVPTAGQHLALAEWCYENQLLDAAQQEVKQALLLEPERRDARDFLQKLQQTMESGGIPDRVAQHAAANVWVDPSHPGQPWKSRMRPERDDERARELSSVGGLSTDTVQMFVRQIQPLLLNKCGDARCHGQAATNAFRLTPVRRGMSGFRILTEKNLSAVLREIDRAAPRKSPLLSVSAGPHAQGFEAKFTGPAGEKQLQALVEWVLSAGGELSRQEHVAGSSSPDGDASLTGRNAPLMRDPFLEQILAEERPDQFDPAIFNEMMHGE